MAQRQGPQDYDDKSVTKHSYQDIPPPGDEPTSYDRAQLRLYLRLLDADAEGADWREVVDILFKIDLNTELERAKQVHASHLRRAKWLSDSGYLTILRSGQG